jgi:hypothetical protein
MNGANPLLGSRANPVVLAGFAAGEYDGAESAAKSMAGENDFTSLKVGIIIGAAALFVIALRRGGFRDMIVV